MIMLRKEGIRRKNRTNIRGREKEKGFEKKERKKKVYYCSRKKKDNIKMQRKFEDGNNGKQTEGGKGLETN